MGKVVAVPKPLSLPFDPIARADELWQQRWGGPVPSMGGRSPRSCARSRSCSRRSTPSSSRTG
ncbi:hypothetical protein GTV15_06455 [Streptomyces sp. SID7803]|nr:hypothetical protein [Streptomyces sp. SID7803]